MNEKIPANPSDVDPANTTMTPKDKLGARFLKERYDLHTTDEVRRAIELAQVDLDNTIEKPEEQIHVYLQRFEHILNLGEGDSDEEQAAIERRKERNLNLLKKALYKKYVIDHVPEAHLELQRKIMRNEGRGADIPEEFSKEQIAAYLEVIQNDQKESLDRWIDYLASDNAMYPDWAKYWALQSVLQMSKYDKEKHEFGERTATTVAAFPELREDALAEAVNVLVNLQSPELQAAEEAVRQQRNALKRANGALRKQKHLIEKARQADEEHPEDPHIEEVYERAHAAYEAAVQERDRLLPQNPVETGENDHAEEGKLVSDEEFNDLLNTKNFAKYYAFAIEHLGDNSELFPIIDGEWRKFDRGSDASVLSDSLQGHGTGWCTAGRSTAESQLELGDFYVYYSENKLGDPKIPRLAIRMQGDQIAEVRGVAPGQDLDPFIAPKLKEKMVEFGEQGEEYIKRAADKERLTELDEKQQAGVTFSADELRFLYELDHPIESFSHYGEPDIRIEEIKEDRNIKDDLRLLYGADLAEPELVNEISKGTQGCNLLIRHLDVFPGTRSTLIPQLLLEQDRLDLLIKNLEKFQVVPAEVLYKAISAGYSFAPEDLQYFSGVDQNKVVRAIAKKPLFHVNEEIIDSFDTLTNGNAEQLLQERQYEYVLQRIERFSKLSLHVAKMLLQYQKKGFSPEKFIVDNIDRFEDLDADVFDTLVTQSAYKQFDASPVLKFLSHFKNLTTDCAERALYNGRFTSLLATGKSAVQISIIENLNSFDRGVRFEVLDITLQGMRYSANGDSLKAAFLKILSDLHDVPIDLAFHLPPEDISEYIKSFREKDHVALAKHICFHDPISLFANIEKFHGVKATEMVEKVIDDDPEATYLVTENIEKFTGLSADIYTAIQNQKIRYEDDIKIVNNNLFRFTGLSREVAEFYIANDQKHLVLENPGSFVGLNSELAEELIANGKQDQVVAYFTSFTGLNSDIAYELIQQGRAKAVRDHLDLFDESEHDEIKALLLEVGV